MMRRGSQEDLVLVPDTLFSSLQKLSRIILCAATILLDFAPFSLLKWSVGVYSCMEIQDREKGKEQKIATRKTARNKQNETNFKGKSK